MTIIFTFPPPSLFCCKKNQSIEDNDFIRINEKYEIVPINKSEHYITYYVDTLARVEEYIHERLSAYPYDYEQFKIKVHLYGVFTYADLKVMQKGVATLLLAKTAIQ